MAGGGLGAVEVQKDSRSRIWYCGFVREVCSNSSELLIAFEEDIWPTDRFPIGGVRTGTSVLDLINETNRLQKVGEEVEMRIDASPHAPACWAVGTVGKIKHDFYVVSLSSAGQKGNDQIVEKEKLRPETFSVPDGLQSWMTTEDGTGCFSHIQGQAGLVAILVQPAQMVLKLVGDKKATQRAKLLLEVHIKHQSQIQNFQDVDGSFIPRIIGKGGETIRALSDKFDVTVRIMEAESKTGPRTIRIFGNSAAILGLMRNLAKARAEVEYVEEAGSLVYTKLDQDREQLLVCGPRSAVQDAMALFDTHLMYHPVFRQMDEEMESIFEELESYGDWEARAEWNSPQDEDWYKGRSQGRGCCKPPFPGYGYGGYGGYDRYDSYRYNGDARPSQPSSWEEQPAERSSGGNRWDQRRKGDRDKGSEETFGSKGEVDRKPKPPTAKAAAKARARSLERSIWTRKKRSRKHPRVAAERDEFVQRAPEGKRPRTEGPRLDDKGRWVSELPERSGGFPRF
eukprot:s447_g3.t1